MVSSKALGIGASERWLEENGVELIWQDDVGLSYGELETDDQKQYLWFEDAKSLQMKMDLIKKYELAGVACWKLGLETEDVWDVVGYQK